MHNCDKLIEQETELLWNIYIYIIFFKLVWVNTIAIMGDDRVGWGNHYIKRVVHESIDNMSQKVQKVQVGMNLDKII